MSVSPVEIAVDSVMPPPPPVVHISDRLLGRKSPRWFRKAELVIVIAWTVPVTLLACIASTLSQGLSHATVIAGIGASAPSQPSALVEETPPPLPPPPSQPLPFLPPATLPPSSPPSSPATIAPADAAAALCSNSCQYAGDFDCDDGGVGSQYSSCDFSSDCDERVPLDSTHDA